jgi:hypothetical protein
LSWGFRLRCGTEPLLRTTGGACTLQQACVAYLVFPPPYTILLVQWRVNDRDLQPSLVVPSSNILLLFPSRSHMTTAHYSMVIDNLINLPFLLKLLQ